MIILTNEGRSKITKFIAECKAKRKEILDVGKGTADETKLPTEEDIVSDVEIIGTDEDGDYFNNWGVTDHYNSDTPISLTSGEDFLQFIPGTKAYSCSEAAYEMNTVEVVDVGQKHVLVRTADGQHRKYALHDSDGCLYYMDGTGGDFDYTEHLFMLESDCRECLALAKCRDDILTFCENSEKYLYDASSEALTSLAGAITQFKESIRK